MRNMGDKSAVDSIIAEAMDSVALDHIAKLNTAHLSSDLPSDLESRFKKLKSFPSSSSSSTNPIPTPTFTASKSLPMGKENSAPAPAAPPSRPPPPPPVEAEVEVEDKTPVQIETPPLKTKSPNKPSLPNSHFDDESSWISPSKRRDRPSPTQISLKGCCFPFSPKKLTTSTNSPKSKGKDRNIEDKTDELFEWGDMNKNMVADIKEQQRKLKKALKEQEKVSKEAAKMVRLVKHASARMTVDIQDDDLFSEEDLDEEHKI